ncbi:hypothetical protein WJX72_012364 [[Myrmecia] bisecta]|uniref:Cation/H+ exchanger transmembrane domain-containing protein n=1 Tax=[Myrmecia] bisecta TaxID=41462 RepID=A0AAW1PPJ6_9CHLO
MAPGSLNGNSNAESKGRLRSLVCTFLEGFYIKPAEAWDTASVVILVGLLYAGLYLAIGQPFLPEGPAWAVLLIWAVASAGGWLVTKLHFPGPLGMILAGMAVRNIHHGSIVSALPRTWSKEIRAAALSLIFLRSGLELDFGIFKRVGACCIRLLLVPGVIEAFFDGGLCIAFFNMPPTFAFAVGFILKAVGPALVIQCMFEVQQQRLGVAKAIPATVVAAASFDDMIAITGYTLFINLAVQSTSNQAWSILHGPLSVIFGIIAGIICAVVCSFTKLWNNRYKRTSVVLLLALGMKFFFDRYNFTSGGAIGSLTLGLCLKEMYGRGWPGFMADGEGSPELARTVEKHVRWLWRAIMMPLLFGLIGNTMNFATIAKNTIPKACAIIIAGLAVRMPVTFLVMLRAGFTFREKLFFAIAWSPKATVQAALAASPMDAVVAAYKPGTPEYVEYHKWAEDALTIAVFCILICGSIGTILIKWLSPYLLEQAEELADDAASQTASPAVHDQGVEMTGLPSLARHSPLAGGQPALTHRQASKSSAMDDHGPERETFRAQNSRLAAQLEHIEELTREVERRQQDGENAADSAVQLRESIRRLRQKLLEDADIPHTAEDVEGAEDFVRATATNLRHRRVVANSPVRSANDLQHLPL